LGRRYVFFEKEIINAIQKRTELGSPSTQGWEKKRESFSNEEGSVGVEIRDQKKIRRRLERKDEHGLFG
jgi:hypothetical protein